MARKKIELPPELAAELRAFAEHFGDRWRDVLLDYHLGRPHESRFIAPMRRIRNNVTPNPGDLPDPRDGGTP